MKNSWVIIWVSNFCKSEGVVNGVYLNKETAEIDAHKRSLQDNAARFYVVEYDSKEHKNAIMRSGKDPF